MTAKLRGNETSVTLAAPRTPPYIALDAVRHPELQALGACRIKGSGLRSLMGPPPYNIAEVKR